MINLKGKPFYLNDAQITWVQETLHGMTTEQKLQQLFVVNFRDYSDGALEEMLAVLEPGAVMYRPGDPQKELHFSRKLRDACKLPMLIAANLEAGGNGIVAGGTLFGAPMAVAATNDEANAARLASICALEGRAVGANWAFAPIVDIDFNWRNPVTNTRTFGSDPERVARMGRAYVEELQKHRFAACIKHFPGDGRDERDQHLLSGVNDCTPEEWFASYGRVYQACIDAGVLTCMVGHIMLPHVIKEINPNIFNEDILPGSQSREVMTGLLRERLGFNGLICTDSSTMAGYMIPLPRWKALPASIMAGADMIVFNKNMAEDIQFMREALGNGSLTEERVDEAVTRILALKAALGLNEENSVPTTDDVLAQIGSKESRIAAQQLADNSITLVKEQNGVLPLSPKKYPRILFYPVEEKNSNREHGARNGAAMMVAEKLRKEGFQITVFDVGGEEEGTSRPQRELAAEYDLIVYVANLASKSTSNALRIEWQEPMWADCLTLPNVIPTVFVALDYPYLLPDVPRVKTYIVTYGSGDDAIDALVEKLMGRSEFRGICPSDFFCGKWDTRL